MDYYGHKLSNGVLFAHHLILDVPGGSSHLGYRRRVPPGHNPRTRVNCSCDIIYIDYFTNSLAFVLANWGAGFGEYTRGPLRYCSANAGSGCVIWLMVLRL